MSQPAKNTEKSAKQASTAGNWQADQPYNQLPQLPPAVEIETRPVLKQCISARAALAELKQAVELIPNPTVLISTMPLLESQASSAIENIVTTTDKLFQYQSDDDPIDPATREALRHNEALLEGFRSLRSRPLTTQTAEQICTQIKGVEMQVRRVPGTALAQEVAGKGPSVIYTPPQGEDLLRAMLANWEKFLHAESGIDPLVRMAVAHYQFEAIHPFTDGNGRTGRVLNSLFFIHADLLTLPVLYLSRYIIANKQEYYRLLLEVTTNQNWEAWILFLIKGVEEMADWTRAKITAIRQLFDQTSEYICKELPKSYSYELVSLIFELPYCRIQSVVKANIAERQTASQRLKELVKINVLEEVQVGREKLFLHPKLLRLLTQDSNELLPYESTSA